jgi:hypothetical protein
MSSPTTTPLRTYALVILFAWSAKAIRKQVVADQLAEGTCALTLGFVTAMHSV